MTKLDEIEDVAAREMISPIGCLPNEWEPNGKSSRAWCDLHVGEVDACRTFIRSAIANLLPTRDWSRRDSYNLKHEMERVGGGYACNGSFIIAAILEGFTVKRHGVNASFKRGIATK